ncbi:MAG: DNA polymerase IV [Patescibacteria group bacterium]|nr:MAG: DNA polymerase IV [Patescibacteria group bacterium]
MSQRIILHIDFDSFFASVEQQCNPFLRNKPIGVTATNGRTCIIASSREAKRLGINTGMRTFEALRICPNIIFVPADFRKYWEVSKKFIALCSDFSPEIEVFSLDEIFMDATLTVHLYGGVESLVRTIKLRIQEELGEYITVSVGIAPNKMLAKLASGLKKPNGVFVISSDQIESVYSIAKLQDICGIGPRIEARLNQMGIYTLNQLRRTPLSALIAEFGPVEGQFLKDVGLGKDTSQVRAYTKTAEVKSVGRQYCLPQNEYNRRVILQHIYELSEEIGRKLRKLKKKARSVGLSLVGSYTLFGQRTKEQFIDSGLDLFKESLSIIRRESGGELPLGYVRRIGVWAGYLKDSQYIPSPLLYEDKRKERLMQVVDALNERFGDHTIRNGFLLGVPHLTTVPNGWMSDRFERKKLAEEYQTRHQ